MKLQSFKRIIKDDIQPEFRPLIEKIGSSINTFAQEALNAFNKNLTIADNLNQEIKTIEVEVKVDNTPKTVLQFKNNLLGMLSGIIVINVENLTNNSNYLSAAPFINFSQNGNIITIHKITGISPDVKYRLTLNTIGG